MPAPLPPPEFRRRAIDLARQPGASVARVAKDLGISESGLRRWMAQDDIDTGRKEGLSTSDREELAKLRRDNRRLVMEVEILKRASAYFARENVLPNRVPAGPGARRRRVRRRGGLPGLEGLTLELLRVARPATVEPGRRGRLPGEHDPRHPRHVTVLLRRAAGARRAPARDGGAGRPQARRAAAAHSRSPRYQPPAQAAPQAG